MSKIPLLSTCYPAIFPAEQIFNVLELDNGDFMELPKVLSINGNWGKPTKNILLSANMTSQSHPIHIDMIWLSVVEKEFYSIESSLCSEQIDQLFDTHDTDSKQKLYESIVVGMAPYGGVALWVHGYKKSTLVDWFHAEKTKVEMKEVQLINFFVSLDEYCDSYINNDERVRENLEVNGLPARDLFDRYMQQFCYRYLVMFERWDEDKERWAKPELDEEGQPIDGKPLPEFDFIEEALWDGTHDKLHDGGLMSYHQAGKPKKLALEWHIKKSQYSAYLWFEDEAIRAAFEKFYGAHRDTKVDFIIRIDPEKNKYELALYRYGLQEPVAISEDTYQMIVFKSKFEYYRSENYDQPRGAWIW